MRCLLLLLVLAGLIQSCVCLAPRSSEGFRGYYKYVNGVLRTSPLYLSQRARVLAERGRAALDAVVGGEPTYVNVTMRDGLRLGCRFYTPFTTPAATVFVRSPYAFHLDTIAEFFLLFNFAVFQEDVRGTGLSGGNFTYWHGATEDGTDTIKYIQSQSWSNGQIYTIGTSADGINALEELRVPQPAIRASFFIVTTGAPFDITYPGAPGFAGNSYRKQLTHNWLHGVHKDWRPRAPPYEPVIIDREAFSPWWNATWLPATRYAHAVPAVFAAGWFDIFCQMTINAYQGFAARQPSSRLIVGPRGHCQKSNPWVDLVGRESLYFAFEMALKQFGVHFDAGQGVGGGLAERFKNVTMFVLGPAAWNITAKVPLDAVGNYWSTIETFPPASAVSERLYLDSATAMLLPPTAPTHPTGATSFIYDPHHPTPTIGGNNLFHTCGPFDQSANEARSDNVLFTTAPFAADRAICGQMNVTLSFRTNVTDTDLVVRATDVWPDGHSMLIGDMSARMRWRTFHQAKPAVLTPNLPYSVAIALWSTCYVMNKGHALRIAVTSSNFPRFSLNLNNGKLMKDGNVRGGHPVYVANTTILTGKIDGTVWLSYVDVPFVEVKDLPNNI